MSHIMDARQPHATTGVSMAMCPCCLAWPALLRDHRVAWRRPGTPHHPQSVHGCTPQRL